jgi:sarcosine oxidase delta subunit
MAEVDMYLRGVTGNFVSQITCPYCEVQQDALLEMGWRPQVILCDNEVQGCDKYFTVKIHSYTATVEYGWILDKDGTYAG